MNRIFIALCLLIVLAASSAAIAHRYLVNYWADTEALVFEEEYLFAIKRGEALGSVMRRVDGLAKDSQALATRAGTRLFAKNGVIKSGEYALLGGYSRASLLELFSLGSNKQYRVTLVEGQTISQLTNTVLRQFDDTIGFSTTAEEINSQLASALDPRAVELMGGARALEGWFYPDTYFFTRESEAVEPFLRAHRAQVELLLDEWPNRDPKLPLETPYEALILASIIERESGHIDERRKISGVFVRRLLKGMKLQTDPTVIYGMGDRYTGNITRKDLQRDTVYNTYTRYGLPPTPIANPGRASIVAALHPAEGSALYFVAKGDGSHVFSDSLEQHNRAVRRYQILKRRADYRSAPLNK